MWKSFFRRSKPCPPRLPDGIRIYAVGDVHGCAELLDRVLTGIEADLAKRPVSRSIHVFLGDYIDRGPASAAAVDRLIAYRERHESVLLKGNHEILLVQFLADPSRLEKWRHFGGLQTLMSYGLKPSWKADEPERHDLATTLKRKMPKGHKDFFAALKTSFSCGDFFFAHAGVRPGIPLAAQSEVDLAWIRDEFLLHERDFGKLVVHGHTPVQEPEIRSNRINIDTGAYMTGRLTCLIVEGEHMTVM